MRSSRFVSFGWLLTAACVDAAGGTATVTSAPGVGTTDTTTSVSGAAGTDAASIASAQAGTGAAAGSGGTESQPGYVDAGSAAAPPMAAAAGSGEPSTTMPTVPTLPTSPTTATMTAALPSPSSCPAPPAGATAVEINALNAVNSLRLAAGAACVNLDLTIGQAASAHCAYYAMNKSADPMCTDNPHYEVMGCAGFTGAGPVERMHAAGFVSSGGGEVMAFLNDPLLAVQMWVDSVWHRIPILDPGTVILGYGAADGCDTIDFGPGMRRDEARVVVYPFEGQTGVTTTFDGRYEGPMPPAPPAGWPSANPISLYAQGVSVTEHQLFVDGDSTPLEHTWLDPLSPALPDEQKRMLRNVVFMYGNAPFLPNTAYRVKMSGTYAGGLLSKEWTFTTGPAPAGRGRP